MKVMFLCHNLTGGGAERVCVDVANGLSRRGNEVVIVTDTTRDITYKNDEKVRLIKLPNEGYLWWKLMRRIMIISFFMKIFKKEKPDVFVSFLCLYAEQAKIASLLTIHCKVVASFHDSMERPEGAKYSLRDKWNRKVVPYFLDGSTVLTNRDKQLMSKRFRNVSVKPNPLFLTPVYTIPEKKKVVLAVGRVEDWFCKGFDILLDAWSIIGSEYPDWQLHIVGKVSSLTKEKLTKKLKKISNYRFLPYTPNIIDEYLDASIFVLSSRYEGFGLVLTEAMSQGCAVIACDYLGRQSEIVGLNGLTIPVSNTNNRTGIVTSMAQDLTILIEDKTLRMKLQEKASRGVDRYSIDNVALDWESYLSQVQRTYKK